MTLFATAKLRSVFVTHYARQYCQGRRHFMARHAAEAFPQLIDDDIRVIYAFTASMIFHFAHTPRYFWRRRIFAIRGLMPFQATPPLRRQGRDIAPYATLRGPMRYWRYAYLIRRWPYKFRHHELLLGEPRSGPRAIEYGYAMITHFADTASDVPLTAPRRE